MRARRLQEIYCRFEIRRTLRAAKDERHLLSSLMTVDHSLFLRPYHSWINGEIFEKEGIQCFLLTLPLIGEWSLSCLFAYSQRWGFHYFIWPTARVIVAFLRRIHRSR